MKSAQTVAAENINVNPVIPQNMPVLTSITAYPIPIRAKVMSLIKNIATVTASLVAPSARTAVLQTTVNIRATAKHKQLAIQIPAVVNIIWTIFRCKATVQNAAPATKLNAKAERFQPCLEFPDALFAIIQAILAR